MVQELGANGSGLRGIGDSLFPGRQGFGTGSRLRGLGIQG